MTIAPPPFETPGTPAVPVVPTPAFAHVTQERKLNFGSALALTGAGVEDSVLLAAAKLLESVADVKTDIVEGTTGDRAAIRFVVVEGGPADSTNEAYQIEISELEAVVTAHSGRGVARAAATLAQLLTVTDGSAMLPQGVIRDEPRFSWRGLSLDVARSFYPVPEVKAVIDLCYLYKLNVLHLHLTDDQGWRLEIPSRPELTEISGATSSDGGRAGFYTVEDFANLQEYAHARGITVVPEIDLPGHTNAATHAIGELNPSGEPTAAYGGMKVGFSMLHPGLEATEPFVRDVITSVASQTQGDYVHFGGDEPLDMDPQDYRDLVTQIYEVVAETGKNPVGWQEAAAAPLPAQMIYQFWDPRLSRDDVETAVAAGAKVILSPGDRTYLDMKYDASTSIGQDWAALIELGDSYEWDPASHVKGVKEADVVGVEAAVWTETIHSFEDLTYMLLPRLAAVAEVGWSPQTLRDWDSFAQRIATQSPVWERFGVRWHASPAVNWGN